MLRIGEVINNILGKMNLRLSYNVFPHTYDSRFKKIYEKCKNYTMTSEDRMYALYNAIKYIVDAKIPGDIVECGVWKGGSSMISAHTLLRKKDKKRKIYLYDTFTGMSEPTKHDKISFKEKTAEGKWNELKKEGHNLWCYSPLNEVKQNMYSTKYPKNKIVFVKGKVENTIPKKTPKKIALLRLDTDWFESTYHEIKHLFHLLSENGVLIVDDYGHWEGSKKAVEKYFKEKKIKMLLNVVDYSGRIGIKI